MTDRGSELGAALRALPTPDHGPGFWDDVEGRLASEPPSRRRHRPRRRARLRGSWALSLAAAVLSVVAAVVVTRDAGEVTRVTTEPPPAPELPRYRPGPARTLGPGLVAGMSADGTAVLVAAEDPSSRARGCEGMPAQFLFAVPVDGGARRRATAGSEPVVGDVLRSPEGSRVAIVSSCEEFLSDVHLAREEAGGMLRDLRRLDRDLLAELLPRLTWSSDGESLLGVVSGTWDVVRVDPTTGARRTLAAGGDALLAGELANGTLVVLTRHSRMRIGEEEHEVRAFAFAVSPDGRQVAAYGEGGLWVLAPGRAPRQLATGLVSGATWAPGGGALAYLSEGALRLVSGTGTVTEVVPASAVSSGVFTPDGGALVYSWAKPAGGGLDEYVVSLVPLR